MPSFIIIPSVARPPWIANDPVNSPLLPPTSCCAAGITAPTTSAAKDAVDLPVPGQKYTFGVVKAAQARGDFQVLAERGRRALRLHLGPDVKAGLVALSAAVDKALR